MERQAITLYYALDEDKRLSFSQLFYGRHNKVLEYRMSPHRSSSEFDYSTIINALNQLKGECYIQIYANRKIKKDIKKIETEYSQHKIQWYFLRENDLPPIVLDLKEHIKKN